MYLGQPSFKEKRFILGQGSGNSKIRKPQYFNMNKEAKEKPTSWDVGSQIPLWGHTLERPRNVLHHLLKICIFSHSLPLRPKALSCENFTGTLIHTTVSCNSLVRIQMKALFDSKIIHILNFLLIFLHSIYFDNPLSHPPAPPWSSPPPCPPNPMLKKNCKNRSRNNKTKKNPKTKQEVCKNHGIHFCVV